MSREFQLDVDGHFLTIIVEADITFHKDLHCGQDADGSRGQIRYFVDKCELEYFDSRGNNLTRKLRKLALKRNLYSRFCVDCEEKMIDTLISEIM